MSLLIFAVVAILLVCCVVYLMGALGLDPKARNIMTAVLVVLVVVLIIAGLMGWMPVPVLR